MARSFEYKFVRLGECSGSAIFGVQDKAPGVAAFGAARYYELIFERERAEEIATTEASRELVGSAERA
jgi:hypothetical protein